MDGDGTPDGLAELPEEQVDLAQEGVEDVEI